MPTMEVTEVPMPDCVYMYICLSCGKKNNYYESICQTCDEVLDTAE
jgi:NMD protein affecting ribosome stability and mRNA decay